MEFKDFNPNFGGLNRNASLVITDQIYQTLPIYENLKSSGVYVYPGKYRSQEKKRSK